MTAKIIILVLLAALGVAIGIIVHDRERESASVPVAAVATQDVARYTQQQVYAAVHAWGLSNSAVTGCNSAAMTVYQGDGVWQCGRATFDERTGQVLGAISFK